MNYNTQNAVSELKKILDMVGCHAIWRPVVLPDGKSLADGIGDAADGPAQDFWGLDLKGRSVIDLGCNLGYYCFQAKKSGAARVVGVDLDRSVIRGATLLQSIYDLSDISFVTHDIITLPQSYCCDIGMMIDFIGKNFILAGLVPKFLDALERLSRLQMIISLRSAYRIDKHLHSDARTLKAIYTDRYIDRGNFHNLQYVVDRFQKDWSISELSQPPADGRAIKQTFLFTRKGRIGSK